jgi:hypothetical protein
VAERVPLSGGTTMDAEPNLGDYRRFIFKLVADKHMSAQDACGELFGIMSTIVASMPDVDVREHHIDAIELRFRQVVYDNLRERPQWLS